MNGWSPQRIVGGRLFLAVVKGHRLASPKPGRSLLHACLYPQTGWGTSSALCDWAGLGWTWGLGVNVLSYRDNFFPKVSQTEMSLVLKVPECVWSESYFLLLITHRWRKALWLVSLAAQDDFALWGLHGPFRIIKPSSGSLNDLICAHSWHVKGNYLKRYKGVWCL